MKFFKDIVLPWCIFLLFLLCFIFFVNHFSMQSRWRSVQLQHLDRLRPERFEPFCNHPEGDVLRIYQKYFEDVDIYFKHSSAQALGLLGYCAFQQKNWQKAGDYYQQAMKLEPGFFWYTYNLAICFLKEQKYSEAVVLLERCINMDARPSVLFISLSKQMYAPIIQACFVHPDTQSLVQQLADARQRAKDILLLLQMKLNHMSVDLSSDELTIAFY